MRLLIITQKVDRNDSILGFFHTWIEKFAKHFSKVTVICLERGEHDLPSNVKVCSLGKEAQKSKIEYVVNLYTYVIGMHRKYDAVFVHMNPIYVVLAGFVWLFMRKPMYLWYTHKHVDWKLRIATLFVKKVFSASKESFRLKTKKLVVTGHGIDTERFAPGKRELFSDPAIQLLSVGRISKTKNYEVIIEALTALGKEGEKSMCTFVGGPVTGDDEVYEKTLHKQVEQKELTDHVQFVGALPPSESLTYFQQADMLLHTSETGSLDKVVLEAMACGIPVLSSNDAARSILAPISENLVFEKGNADDMAAKIGKLKNADDDLRKTLRREVVEKHAIEKLITRLAEEIDHA